jgi:hypothetical protein
VSEPTIVISFFSVSLIEQLLRKSKHIINVIIRIYFFSAIDLNLALINGESLFHSGTSI